MPTSVRPRDARGRFISTRPPEAQVPAQDVSPVAESPRLPDRYPAEYAVTTWVHRTPPRFLDHYNRLRRNTWGDPYIPMVTDESGERWCVPNDWAYYRNRQLFIRDDDTYTRYEERFPYGPSVRECNNRCIWADGCSVCNPSQWRTCEWSCSGRDIYRSPLNGPCRCWQSCADCEERVNPYSIYHVTVESDDGRDSRYVCTDCLSAYDEQCEDCGVSWNSAEWEHDCPNACTCAACQGSRYSSDRPIRSYSYKPDPVFHGDGPVYMGMECEVSTEYADKETSAIARHVQNRLGDLAYLKSDGSIGEGFEIVTHPMSYRYALGSFPWDMWEELRDRFGMRESEDCGLHIHVNRDGFSGPVHTYRWMKFVYRNRRNVRRVARRDSDEWAPFRTEDQAWLIHAAKAGARAGDDLTLIRSGYSRYDRSPDRLVWYARDKVNRFGFYQNRYSAINNTNTHTLEVRVFAGSLDADDFRAALAFIAGSVEYTRQLTAHDIVSGDGWTWSAFTTWAEAQGDTYEPLLSFLDRN